MSNFVPHPEQPFSASPEHEARLRYLEANMNEGVAGLAEAVFRIVRERVPAIEQEREAATADYTEAGFEKLEAWAQRCDMAVLGTDFADDVEYELEQVTPYLHEDPSHWGREDYDGKAISEDKFRNREDEWQQPEFPLDEVFEYINRYAKRPKPGSKLGIAKYREQEDRWNNFYVDGIEVRSKHLGSEEDGEGE